MRNPARIYPLLNKIGDIWIKNNQLRLGQLINIIVNKNRKATGRNLFFLEDEDLEKLIDIYNKK